MKKLSEELWQDARSAKTKALAARLRQRATRAVGLEEGLAELALRSGALDEAIRMLNADRNQYSAARWTSEMFMDIARESRAIEREEAERDTS